MMSNAQLTRSTMDPSCLMVSLSSDRHDLIIFSASISVQSSSKRCKKDLFLARTLEIVDNSSMQVI